MISYKKYQKYIPKKNSQEDLSLKKYEYNSRDQMYWMRFYKTCLLIISNYSQHLHEKINNTSYSSFTLKKKKTY